MWTGKFLVQEQVSNETHLPIPIDVTLDAQGQYFHTQVTLAGAKNSTITLPFSVATVLYVKGRFVVGGLAAGVGVAINGSADVDASDLMIFDTAVASLNVENLHATLSILVEIAAVGE